ncbi:Ribonuclease P protein component [Candidatus Hepatincola sp. Av]
MSIIRFIKKSAEYDKFKKNSHKLVSPAFVLLFFADETLKNNEIAVGLIASAKIGNSVVRHKVKRRIRNICISVLQESKVSGFSICIIARKPAYSLQYQKIKDSFINAINSMGK